MEIDSFSATVFQNFQDARVRSLTGLANTNTHYGVHVYRLILISTISSACRDESTYTIPNDYQVRMHLDFLARNYIIRAKESRLFETMS